MSAIAFARGGAAKAGGKKSGLQHVVEAVTGVAGGGCGTGTHNGKRGFQPGNKCAQGRKANPAVSAAKKNFTAKHTVVRKHTKAGTLLSKEGRQALRDASAAHRALQAARATHQATRTAARAETRRATRATAAAARVQKSARQVDRVLVGRATQHLHDLKAGAAAGAFKPTDIHKHVERIARGTTKDSLFAAARAAGIEHNLATKKALVEHLKDHVHEHGKARQAEKAAAPDAAKLPLKDFADRVVQGAHASPTGGFGAAKTFISHVKFHLETTDPAFRGMSDEAFKARLLEAHRAGLLELGRADLVEAMDPADVRASKVAIPGHAPESGHAFHFVRHPDKKKKGRS